MMSAAHGQSSKGSIRGHVTDQTNSVLQGARVTIDPNAQTTITDANGDFSILGLAPGTYTVSVSYLGFNTYTQKVDVSVGAPATLAAALQVANAKQEVTVYAGRESGEVEALNREMTADNILQVMPSEVINSLPNTNIADAVGRMPSVSLERDEGEGKYIQIRGTEPRLSNVTVDGIHLPSPENVRNVKLDVIPADLVESIEVSKTLSANQDGDAIGGSVNLVTRSATDQPYISAMGLFGHNPIAGGRGSDQYELTAGQRFGQHKQFGALFGTSFDWNGRGINDIEPVQGANDAGTYLGPTGMDIRDYLYDRKRFGFGGTLDYKLGEMSSVYLRGIFARFRDSGEDWIYSPSVDTSTLTANGTGPGSVSFTNVYRRPVQQLFSAQQGARIERGANLFIYNIALSQAGQKGGYNYADFSNSATIPFTINTADPFTPHFNTPYNLYDPTQYALSDIYLENDHTFERDVVGDISFAHRYSTSSGSRFGAIEVGMKVSDANKNQFFFDQGYNYNGTATMADLQGSFTDPNYYLGRYTYGPVTQFSKALNLFAQNPGQFSAYSTTSSDVPNDYNVGERIYAGYVMNTITISHFRLQTGVRIEATRDDVLGNNYDVGTGATSVLSTSNTYVNVLPSVQLSYNFNGSTALRFGYGIGISRPNFGDLAPYRIVDATSSPASITLGTPGLKPTHAQNFDLVIEKYLQPVGILQLGGFYKELADPIFFAASSQTISGTAYQVLQQVNGPSAKIGGIEASWQQQLRFLPGALNGMGVRANYSYTTSTVSFPAGFNGGRTDHPLLNRNAPNNWNFDATYDKYNFSARMGLTHNDANIWAYNYSSGATGGMKGPNGDLYLYPHTQVDAELNYVIPHGKGFRVVASVLNLNNEVFGFYQGSEQYPIQREYYKPTYAFGLRWIMPVSR
jgi:TonB-dependent receptor